MEVSLQETGTALVHRSNTTRVDLLPTCEQCASPEEREDQLYCEHLLQLQTQARRARRAQDEWTTPADQLPLHSHTLKSVLCAGKNPSNSISSLCWKLILNFLKELTTTRESEYYESTDWDVARKELLKVVEEVTSKLRK